MSLPLLTSAVSVKPDGGQKIEPRDMVAIRIKRPCPATIDLEGGQTATGTITEGTLGFLMRYEGDKAFVQVMKPDGKRGLCRVPRDVLEIGVPNSQSKIKLPHLESALAVAPLANSRAQDPAGKAILNIWEDIHKNKAFLRQYGLRLDIYDMVLEDANEKRRALNAILASFSNDVWEALNTSGLPLEPFLGLRAITATWPRLTQKNQALIYLRLYTNGSGSPSFGKYVGRTVREYPHVRMLEHNDNHNNPNKPGTHYREARRHQSKHSIPMMVLKDFRPEVLPMAEMTLCSLLRSWNPLVAQVSQESISEGASSANLSHRILMMALSRITDSALKRVNFPLFNGTGCNWSCPLQELVFGRREWVRYRVKPEGQRSMLVYRCQSHVCRFLENQNASMGMRMKFLGRSHGSAGSDDQTQDRLDVRHRLEGLPGIRVGLPLIISIELMEDGGPHATPWYRHPYHGAWSNSGELHSFCIKVEWMDESTGKWYTTSLQHALVLGSFEGAPTTVTPAWRKATLILQFLHNRRYQNPPPWLYKSFHQVVRQVEYDHLNQTISFSDIPETVLNPPTQVSFDYNIRELYKASLNEWKPMTVGPKPPPEWWYRPGTGKKDTGCSACVTGHYMFKMSETTGCSKREGNFIISPDEPNVARVREWSCHLCWTYWRRPCTWLPAKFGIEEGQVYDHYNYQLPPAFTGLVVMPYRQLTATEISAPMTMDEYYSIAQENEVGGDELVVRGGED